MTKTQEIGQKVVQVILGESCVHEILRWAKPHQENEHYSWQNVFLTPLGYSRLMNIDTRTTSVQQSTSLSEKHKHATSVAARNPDIFIKVCRQQP